MTRLLILALTAPALLAPAATTVLEKHVVTFFSQHCNSCHDEKKQKGDLRVDTLAVDLQSPKIMGHWEEIMNRIISGALGTEGRSGMSYGHSNLPTLLADGENLDLKHGQHINYNRPHLKEDYTLSYDEWKFLCGKPKDEKDRLSNVMITMLQKMEVNAEKFVDSLGPVSEVI